SPLIALLSRSARRPSSRRAARPTLCGSPPPASSSPTPATAAASSLERDRSAALSLSLSLSLCFSPRPLLILSLCVSCAFSGASFPAAALPAPSCLFSLVPCHSLLPPL